MEEQLFEQRIDLSVLHKAVVDMQTEIKKVIVGQDDMVRLLVAAILADGHVLIEGVPGVGKTLTAKLVAKAVQTGFSRIQFTPDLMPSDVLGTNIFNPGESKFEFKQGPVFSNIILIDEINRAPAKTQSALFEVMEERQVTIDGITHHMSFPFMVIATQNPIEQEGTYRLPEAQLDRFLFRIKLNYLTVEQETEVLKRFRDDFTMKAMSSVEAVLSKSDMSRCQQIIEKIHIKDEILSYIAQVVASTRSHSDLSLGASPRASLAIMRAAKAIAAMSGRDFVTPDDVKYVAAPVLNHRIILTAEREMEGVESEDVIKEITERIEIPR